MVTPTADSELGAKGAGEAGTAGAPQPRQGGLHPLVRLGTGKPLTDMPFTPGRILQALDRV